MSSTLVSIRGKAIQSHPKTAKSHRIIGLALAVVGALRAHRTCQFEERLARDPAWLGNDGLVFVDEVGRPVSPDHALRLFQRAASRAGLPQIALQGLRHSAATAGLATDVPLLATSKRLGHSSVSITGDLYSHAVEQVDREAADRTAALLLPRVAHP